MLTFLFWLSVYSACYCGYLALDKFIVNTYFTHIPEDDKVMYPKDYVVVFFLWPLLFSVNLYYFIKGGQ